MPPPPSEVQQNYFNIAPTLAPPISAVSMIPPPAEEYGARFRVPFIGAPLPMRPAPMMMTLPPFIPRPIGLPPGAPMYPPPRVGLGIYYPSMDPSRLGAKPE